MATVGKYRPETTPTNEQGLYHIISQSTAKNSGHHFLTKKFKPIGSAFTGKIIFSTKSIGRMEQKFDNNDLDVNVRTLKNGDEVLFYAKDVTKALGYKNTRNAIQKHVWDEDKRILGDLQKVPRRRPF